MISAQTGSESRFNRKLQVATPNKNLRLDPRSGFMRCKSDYLYYVSLYLSTIGRDGSVLKMTVIEFEIQFQKILVSYL